MDLGDRDHTNWEESWHFSNFLSLSLSLSVSSDVLCLLTGELYRKSLLADEIVWIKLQREDVESRVDIFRESRARPFFQQDPPVRWPRWTVPDSQDIVADLSVKDDEVEAKKTQQYTGDQRSWTNSEITASF